MDSKDNKITIEGLVNGNTTSTTTNNMVDNATKTTPDNGNDEMLHYGP